MDADIQRLVKQKRVTKKPRYCLRQIRIIEKEIRRVTHPARIKYLLYSTAVRSSPPDTPERKEETTCPTQRLKSRCLAI
jgi:hypothetical protein